MAEPLNMPNKGQLSPESTNNILPITRRQILNRSSLVVAGIVLAAFLFFATAIRHGHDWGGDYAQYILHAQALVQGLDYAPPPGFIVNPYLVWVPPAYPPFYPICIAAIVGLFGLNFILLKLQIVLFFALSVAAYWFVLRTNLPSRVAVGALAFLAFSPYYLKYANKVLTEIPFLAVSLFTILVAQRFFRDKSSLLSAAGLVILTVLACSTRSVGLALILALPAYTLLFKRTHFIRATLVSIAAFGVVYLVSANALGVYFNQTRSDPLRILKWLEGKPEGYFTQLTRFFALYPKSGSPLAILNSVATALYLILATLGLTHLFLRRKIKYQDVYTGGFIAAVIIYPLPRIRYLLPIIPFLSIYAFHGLRLLLASLRKLRHTRPSWIRKIVRHRFLIPVIAYLPLFALYWGHYTFQPTTPAANILVNPDVRDLFEVVEKTDYSGVIFDRPRVLTLFTGVRAAACFNAPDYLESDIVWDLERLLDLASTGDISHIILDRRRSATWLALNPIISRNPSLFTHSYSNGSFDIFEIHLNGS